MTQVDIATITHALVRFRGDDLERARAAFRYLSEEALDAPHGQSGFTRRQILQQYEDHVARVESALQAIKGLR